MNKSSYATYADMPLIPYRIVEHLLTDEKAEIIWKLLKYYQIINHSNLNIPYQKRRGMIL